MSIILIIILCIVAIFVYFLLFDKNIVQPMFLPMDTTIALMRFRASLGLPTGLETSETNM